MSDQLKERSASSYQLSGRDVCFPGVPVWRAQAPQGFGKAPRRGRGQGCPRPDPATGRRGGRARGPKPRRRGGGGGTPARGAGGEGGGGGGGRPVGRGVGRGGFRAIRGVLSSGDSSL